MSQKMDFDAIVIGGGFGGLYAVKKLRDELKLKVQAFDKATDVAGTWYWNRYPGALSDTETHLYCYSWDKELLQSLEIKRKYVQGPDVRKYLQQVAEKHDLKKSYQFNTAIQSAHYNEADALWEVTTEYGNKYTARFLITALGLLSAPNLPNIKGIHSFKGELHHTSRWPDDVSFEGKRVGVIGTGSTGVQVITAVAPLVKHLTVFQRSAQYSVPIGNDPMSEQDVKNIKDNYDKIWEGVWNSALAFGLNESTVPAMSVSAEERKAVFEKAWQTGGGFRFMFETFGDIATNMEANIEAQNFIKAKIAEIVKDPETAKKLTPQDLYAKRPLCDSGYYNTFNRDNVRLEDVKANPIVEITENGVKLENGDFVELDMLICATGFDAVDGNYVRMDIQGKNGLAMRDYWKEGPSSYMGVTVHNYPNMFMVLGPNGPFTNLPPSIESQVEWISDTIQYAVENNVESIEATEAAEQGWTKTCSEIAEMTLFPKAQSWIFGANIPGKKNTVYFYLGGLKEYRRALANCKHSAYEGFEIQLKPTDIKQIANA
ncbi:flavin-containing monooxygenase [Acinetobacter nosocomialis]|uniref:flavin-containing monooxygenase n=2 Tax=Acinetobacter TaxID=469 RepID=UPI0021C06680|nr:MULTISPECIES: NAD(P)/FAD-dependent oxidoreductase [Acinetobacter calcoaceticus/baumannii complex]MDH2532016.1 NAD(P)/FAD-dependent oxidoreductase [Acinetobacter baumannii]